MASLASRSSQALRAASRRVPRTPSKVAPKPANAASYSLLATTRANAVSRRATTFESVRGVKTLDFAGSKEVNGESWKQALEDGWVPGETLFPIEDAIKRGTIIMNLLSDAAQSATWPQLAPLITKGKTLYFSHGFSVVYKEDTKVVPPKDVDVILVAPKGSGRTVRTLFKEGRGINSSIAVWQDVSGKAKERATALGVAIGSGYMYETTFEKEVYSDLYGERGVGMFLAQYKVLRENGHSPSEAFNETVEEATQSLFPLIGEKGLFDLFRPSQAARAISLNHFQDGLHVQACSTTARRGALDWAPIFEAANRPVLRSSTREIWRAGKTVRSLRPDYKP
ncbi:hypothetical protein BJV77DRAFT_1061307 [Russula vinacea]|nr:hypothetical protein BJV77DRAFT_1061307 [Russula vinacea]